MVPLSNREGTDPKRIFVPSVPADARAALLSKRSVRAVAARRRLHVKPFADSDGEEILCICRGKDDGRELVQCDDCRTWYHLECLGIKDIADLGREEDPWYCHNCITLRLPIQYQIAPVEDEGEPPFAAGATHSFSRPCKSRQRVPTGGFNPTVLIQRLRRPTSPAQRQASHIPDRP